MLQYALLSVGSKAWRSLQCPKSELRLDLVLSCGQSFRWRESGDGHWTGVMGGKVWTLTQTNDTLWYYVYASQKSPNIPMEGDMSAKSVGLQKRQKTEENGSDRDLRPTPEHCSSEEDLLRDYFQLNTKLESLYEDWCCRDAHFKQIAKIFPGVRLLRQDPVECLFSFICSSNNHISRIQGMVERLCHKLGPHLATIQDTAYHDFPSLEVLAKGDVEACLRDLGFGYRARFIQQSAQLILSSHSPGWLQELRSATYEEASSSLCSLPGVGLKVADCVCLMSLDKPGALPVDTHVWQIATRDYGYSSGKGQKTLTGKVHKDVGDFFRKLWGPYAGWAQSVMFCADLKRFQKLKDQVDVVKKEPKSEKNLKGLSKNTKKPHRSKGEKAADEVSAKRAKIETQFSKKVKEEPDI